MARDSGLPDSKTDPAKRSRLIVVKPVIMCDDNGGHPARYALPKTLVDQVYTRADLEFLYLDPVEWHHGKGRRGEVNLDTIVAEGRRSGVIVNDPRIVTLLFVSSVDGKTGPLGRGMQNGNVCFVCLGPQERKINPALMGFVVAHEVGHCLNLIHAVDDPNVPNHVPNLQGDGAFEERLAVEGLHPSQVNSVLKSRLVLPRRCFHTAEEAAIRLVKDVWGNRPEDLDDDNLRFQLGLPPGSPVPENSKRRTQFVHRHYAKVAAQFTTEERNFLNKHLDILTKHLGSDWPIVTRLPWHFIKARPGFCSDMPHTRGLAIVMTETLLDAIREHPENTLEILLHEKLHIVQRMLPERFAEAFRSYRYEPVTWGPGEKQALCLLHNPDGGDASWALVMDKKTYFLSTVLTVKNGAFHFFECCHPLKATPAGFRVLPAVPEPEPVATWRSTLPIRAGWDDPREINAYLVGRVFQADKIQKIHTGKSAPPPVGSAMDTERRRLPKLLRLPVTDHFEKHGITSDGAPHAPQAPDGRKTSTDRGQSGNQTPTE